MKKQKEKELREIEKSIFNTFSDLARMIGFSPIHGSIIAALFVSGGTLSLQDLSKKTGYSVSMVSISLDFLEMLGLIKKIKKPTDRKLYIELTGDLLEKLKEILVFRIKKSISTTLEQLKNYKDVLKEIDNEEKNDIIDAINILEKQIKRLEKYVSILSRMKLP